jgi:hypothetical protein
MKTRWEPFLRANRWSFDSNQDDNLGVNLDLGRENIAEFGYSWKW